MEEKNNEYQRIIEEQKRQFLAKDRENDAQRTHKIKIDKKIREIKPLILEANEIAKQLSQNVTFAFGLTGNKPNNNRSLNINSTSFEYEDKNYDIEIKVNNLDSEEQYIWDCAKFNDRLIVMRDLLTIYEEEGEVNDMNHSDNPFVDKREAAVIGEGYYSMEGLSHMIDNPVKINLIGSNY